MPILPSCLDTSLEIPESHASNSLILFFLAMRLTITVTGSKCLSLFTQDYLIEATGVHYYCLISDCAHRFSKIEAQDRTVDSLFE